MASCTVQFLFLPLSDISFVDRGCPGLHTHTAVPTSVNGSCQLLRLFLLLRLGLVKPSTFPEHEHDPEAD